MGTLSLGLTTRMEQRVTLAPRLRQCIGETAGEIPLYSLHRIRKELKDNPPGVSEEVTRILVTFLIRANMRYRAETGNDWFCLTFENLAWAMDQLEKEIENRILTAYDLPSEYENVRGIIIDKLKEAKTNSIRTIKIWFEEDFERLRYVLDGKIPWPVVCRLRSNLGKWIAGASNPFEQDIEDLILEIAEEEGINTDDPNDAWEKMGGKIFKKKERRS